MRLRSHPLSEPIVFLSDLFGDQTAVPRIIAVNLLKDFQQRTADFPLNLPTLLSNERLLC